MRITHQARSLNRFSAPQLPESLHRETISKPGLNPDYRLPARLIAAGDGGTPGMKTAGGPAMQQEQAA